MPFTVTVLHLACGIHHLFSFQNDSDKPYIHGSPLCERRKRMLRPAVVHLGDGPKPMRDEHILRQILLLFPSRKTDGRTTTTRGTKIKIIITTTIIEVVINKVLKSRHRGN